MDRFREVGTASMGRRLSKVAVGGTFDKLHRGHIKLLLKAFKIGDTVIIGLTTDEMLGKAPKNHIIDSYESRRQELIAFLSSKGLVERATIIPLHDSYGTTLANGGLQALVVSKETENVAKEINLRRGEKGMKPLAIYVINMVNADDSVPINTMRIRRGEIDRDGHLIESNVDSN